jgi:hypothetical protein
VILVQSTFGAKYSSREMSDLRFRAVLLLNESIENAMKLDSLWVRLPTRAKRSVRSHVPVHASEFFASDRIAIRNFLTLGTVWLECWRWRWMFSSASHHLLLNFAPVDPWQIMFIEDLTQFLFINTDGL